LKALRENEYILTPWIKLLPYFDGEPFNVVFCWCMSRT